MVGSPGFAVPGRTLAGRRSGAARSRPGCPCGGPAAVRHQRRPRLLQHPPAGVERSAQLDRPGDVHHPREPAAALRRPAADVRGSRLRHAGPDAGADHGLLQGRHVRRPAGRRREHHHPPRRGNDPPRQGVRGAPCLWHHPRRHDVRRRVRERAGPPLLHGRAAQRRAQPAELLRGRREQEHGRRHVGTRAVHRGRPSAPVRRVRRPVRCRGREDPGRRPGVHRRDQRLHRGGEDQPAAPPRRVRRAREARRPEAVARDRHRLDRDPRRLDLRQGRGRRARQRARLPVARSSASAASAARRSTPTCAPRRSPRRR